MIGIWKKAFRLGLFFLGVLLVSACGSPTNGNQIPVEGKTRVVVTTTFVGDVVKNIAGDRVDISALLTAGQNPHSYQPAPMDMVAVSGADLILVNGFGLEDFLDDLLSGTDTQAEVVVVSEGITPRMMEGHNEVDDDHSSEDSMEAVMGQDPHVWFDPNNVLIWAKNITSALAEQDPVNKAFYQANYDAYQEQLLELDVWIREQIEIIPKGQRELVTDHYTLGYFAQEYGLIQIGAVIPALTTEAETSGMELAELIDIINVHQTKAVFVGVDFDPSLAQRVADETGVELVPLYFGSLSDGEPAGTYLSFMRYNVSTIVEALH
ncbi:MAG: zinc ABC transporter substrate-binding protein [Anaerolineales bacterium]|nr:zinc ABC transporter substrate-binding protein [Anaerolineales bacterium]